MYISASTAKAIKASSGISMSQIVPRGLYLSFSAFSATPLVAMPSAARSSLFLIGPKSRFVKQMNDTMKIASSA